MKKLMILIFLGVFIFTLSPISTCFAIDGDSTSTATSISSSNEAERAASTAAMSGISTIAVESVIFATAVVLMAVGISSGIDSPDGQTPGNGHGHGH